MRIAIEAQRIFRKHKHGMDFVVLEMLRELQEIDKENQYYVIVAKGDDHCLSQTSNFTIIELNSSFYPYWEQILLPLCIRKIKPDILHCTSNTAPIICSTPLIVTIHDVIYLEKQTGSNSSWYQNMGRIYRRLNVPLIAKKCETIITVSNYEKECIAKFFPQKENDIRVVYNGYAKHFVKSDDYISTVRKYISTSPYIFFLGNTDPKKNVSNTLKAYAEYLEHSSKSLPLLIADLKEKELNSILQSGGILNIKDKIKLAGYVPNTDLPAIYNGASMFLYTSKRESFGIPLLEAMACGTPVITGNVSALPEIAAGSETITDCFSSKKISETMLKLENDDNLYSSQVEYGLQRVKNFSWRKTAEEVLNIYNEIALRKTKQFR